MKTLIPLLITTLLLSAVATQAAQVSATVVAVQGQAEYAAPGSSTFQALQKGATLPAGSKIKTSAGGSAMISTVPGTATQIQQNTTVTLANLDVTRNGDKISKRQVLLDLQQGVLLTSIEKKGGATDFKVRTPTGIAAARGTAFSTSVLNGVFSLVVTDGAVSVTLPNGNTVTVQKGQKLSITGTGATATASVVTATQAEMAALDTVIAAAVALNILNGQTDSAGVAGGAGQDGALIIVNPANTSGEVSENQ